MKLEKIYFIATIVLSTIIVIRGYILYGWHFNIVNVAYIIYFSLIFYLQYECAFNDFYSQDNKIRNWTFKTIIKSEKVWAYKIFVILLPLTALITLCIIVIPKFSPMYVGVRFKDLLYFLGFG